MFDEVTKKEGGGKRAAKRGAWLAGSTALQAGLVLAIVAATATLAEKQAKEALVAVKIIKAAPVKTAPAPPPPPPPPAAKPKQERPKTDKPKPTNPKPRPAFVVPKEMPKELKAPDPKPAEPEDEDEGVEGGVIGGVAGGVVGAPPAPPAPPPPPPPPKPAGPVKFNNTMAPPKMVSAPPLEYTQQALEREVEGTMIVECVIRVDGTVHDCRVLKGLPFMDGAVVGNLQRRRYAPATQGGQPLDVQYTFTIRLKLPQ